MADDLEENYVIEENFLNNNKKRPLNNDLAVEFDVNPLDEVKSAKKHKKKTITEILELRKDEINKPAFARNELIQILSEHIAKKLSIVEKNDLNLNSDVQNYLNKLILKRKFVKLTLNQQFEKKFDTKISKYLKLEKLKNGQPFAIVLCSSAQRCIEFQKQIDKFTGKRVRWMHGFAKHKKLADQIDYIKKNRINLIFATPNRLLQLLDENDELFHKNIFRFLKYIILDYTSRDCKLKRLLDINEIREGFLKLFFKYLQPVNCKAKKTKIKFYLV